MSILSSLSYAITEAFDTVGDVAKTARKTVHMGTAYVDNRAKSFEETDREYVLIETSKTLAKMAEELKSDENLAAMHKTLADKWGW